MNRVKAMWMAYVELLSMGPHVWRRRINHGQDILCGLRDALAKDLNIDIQDIQECAEEQALFINHPAERIDRATDPVLMGVETWEEKS